MRLAISNIAWEIVQDEAVADLLGFHGIDAIDIAPGKYFSDFSTVSDNDIHQVRDWWKTRAIEITGMQALLFGTTGLNVFGSQRSQEDLLAHLAAVCRIGAGLGATRVVFGSPRNRDRSGLTNEQTLEVAVPFFKRLGDIALSHGVTICLEPNPTCYGANFMTTSAETAAVVRAIDSPAIRMQLDTGALTINGENPQMVLSKFADLIGHVHASEPELLPLGDGGTDHEQISLVLKQYLPNHIVSVEMVATKNEPHLQSIKRALSVALNTYGTREM